MMKLYPRLFFKQANLKLPSLLLSLVLCNVYNALASSAELSTMEAAYYQRDYPQITTQLSQLSKPWPVEAQLIAIAVEVEEENDDAEDNLSALIKQNPNNSKVHYMAGKLWQKIAKRASIFSKRTYYSRYVSAMTKAAQLAPENARYQMEAAKAYGQPSFMGGDISKQKPIVDQLLKGGTTFAQIAYMDHLQNIQNKAEAIRFAGNMKIQYPEDIEVLERAAQLLRTFEQQDQALALFYQTCQLTPEKNEAFVTWGTSCWLIAYFSLNEGYELSKGINASTRLLTYDKVVDQQYQETLLMHGQLLQKAKQNDAVKEP